jgi:hypothetical protein
MDDYDNSRFNSRHIDLHRHYCPRSQRYAGGDTLLAYLENGWTLQEDIYFDEYWHGGARRVTIYYIALVNHEERITMRVLSNPVIHRLLSQSQVRVMPSSLGRGQLRHLLRVH